MKFRTSFLIIIFFLFSFNAWSATGALASTSVLDKTDFDARLESFNKCYKVDKNELQPEEMLAVDWGLVKGLVNCVINNSVNIDNPLNRTLTSLFSPSLNQVSGPVYDFTRTALELVDSDFAQTIQGQNFVEDVDEQTNLLAEMISNFSHIILIIALVFFSYVLIAFKYQSAYTGEFLGGKKGFDGMMSPLKLFFYGALLMPSVYGYSVVQVIVIFFAWFGMLLSNFIWQYFLYLYVHDSMVEQVENIPVDNEAASQSLQKELYSHFAANLLLEMIYLADQKHNFTMDVSNKAAIAPPRCDKDGCYTSYVDPFELSYCLNETKDLAFYPNSKLKPMTSVLKYKDRIFELSAPQVFGLVSPDEYSCDANISVKNFGNPKRCMKYKFDDDFCTFYESTMKEIAFRGSHGDDEKNDWEFLRFLMTIKSSSPWFDKLRLLKASGQLSDGVVEKLKAEEDLLAEKYSKFLARLSEIYSGKDKDFQGLFSKYVDLWRWQILELKKPVDRAADSSMGLSERLTAARVLVPRVEENLSADDSDFVTNFWANSLQEGRKGKFYGTIDLKDFVERFSKVSVAFVSEFDKFQSSITDDLIGLSKQIMKIQMIINEDLASVLVSDFYANPKKEEIEKLTNEKKIEYLKILKIFTGDWLSIPAFLTLNTSKFNVSSKSKDYLGVLAKFEDANPLSLLMIDNLKNPVWKHDVVSAENEKEWDKDLSAQKLDFIENYFLKMSFNDISRDVLASEGRRERALEKLRQIELLSDAQLKCVKSYDSCQPRFEFGFKRLMEDFARPMYNTSAWITYKLFVKKAFGFLDKEGFPLQDFPLIDIAQTILGLLAYFVIFAKLILIYLPLIYILAFFINWIVSIFVLLFAGPILVLKAILPKKGDSSLSSYGDELYKTGLSVLLQPALVVIAAVVFMVVVPLMTNLGIFMLYPLISGTSSMPFTMQYYLLDFLQMIMLVFAIVLSLKVLNQLPKDVLQWIKLKDSGATEEYDSLKSKVKELSAKFFKLSLT